MCVTCSKYPNYYPIRLCWKGIKMEIEIAFTDLCVLLMWEYNNDQID